MYRIFLVEDDRLIATTLQKHLNTWGYETTVASDFHNILPEFAQSQPQLVLLDIALPFYNGYYWCTELRRLSRVPILFLSSLSDNMNIVMAMNMGGDDFIAKPFDLDVLTAKIAALLRRTYHFAPPASLLEHDGAVLNTADASLTHGDARLELSRNEFRILEVLMQNAGRVVSRDTLMTKLWETDSFIDDNTLTVNINRLRRRLADAELTDWIKTKKGLGYLIE